MPFLDFLGVDGLLDALSYANAVTLARLACTSRMGAVAAHEAQQRPSLCVVKGSLETVQEELRQQLAAKPTVVFVQYSVGHHDDDEKQDEFEAEIANFISKKLPPTAQVLGGSTMSLQCAWFPKDATGSANTKSAARKTTLDVRSRDRCEVAVLAATLPEAKAKAFHVTPTQTRASASDSEDEDSYSMEDSDQEDLQENQATGGYGGSKKPGAPAAPKLEDSMHELLNLQDPPKVVVVYDADRGSSTKRILSKIQEAYPDAAIIGGVVMGRRIVARREHGALSGGRGVGALAISGNAPLFAMTCPFKSTDSVKTAAQTVATCMSRAQETATEKCQSILGALLFTCNARGPHMFGAHARDAALFQAQFPQAPLMGFYAAGEIGPQVEEGAEHAFLRGNAAMQGFTAVFGLFLVPSKRMPSAPFQRAMLHGEVQEAFEDTRQS